jgi:hypothetical protein
MRAPLACLGAALLAAAGPAAAQTGKSITNENRLLQRFAEDGAVTENVWFEGQFRFQSFDRVDAFYLEPILAVNVAEDLELGGRLRLLTADPDPGGSETGLTDLDLYGKIRLSTKPTQLAVGILLKLPTGDETRSLLHGTGETDVGFFAGLRRDFSALSLVANAGLRINQDPDAPPPQQPEGEMSVQLGGAALFPLTAKLAGLLEATFETERIDGAGSDLRLTLGADYRRDESFSARLGAAAGSGDAAPDLELIASAVFLF